MGVAPPSRRKKRSADKAAKKLLARAAGRTSRSAGRRSASRMASAATHGRCSGSSPCCRRLCRSSRPRTWPAQFVERQRRRQARGAPARRASSGKPRPPAISATIRSARFPRLSAANCSPVSLYAIEAARKHCERAVTMTRPVSWGCVRRQCRIAAIIRGVAAQRNAMPAPTHCSLRRNQIVSAIPEWFVSLVPAPAG